MFQYMFFFQLCSVGAIVFADHNCEFSAGITQDRGSVDALHAFEKERTPGTCAVRGLLLSETVCIPRHIGFSEPVKRREGSPQACVSLATTLNLGRMGGVT